MESDIWPENEQHRSYFSPGTDIDETLNDAYLDLPVNNSHYKVSTTPTLQDTVNKELVRSPTNMSVVSNTSTIVSYVQPQGTSDKAYQPINEILENYNIGMTSDYKGDYTNTVSNNSAMIQSLLSLQTRINTLESDRKKAVSEYSELSARRTSESYQKKFKSTATETSPYTLSPPVRDQSLQTSSEKISKKSSLPITVSDLQKSDKINVELQSKVDTLNSKCYIQSRELELTIEKLHKTESERQRIEEQVSRMEKKYDKLKSSHNPALPQPVFQVDTGMITQKASEAINRLEERQHELSRNQHSTESKIKLLEDELRSERDRCKILQNRTAMLQATSDASHSLMRASALSLQSNEEKKIPKKKIIKRKLKPTKMNKQSNSGAIQRNTVGNDHFRMELKNIPFVVGTSTTPSYSVGANYQQILSMLKKHNASLCCSNSLNANAKEFSQKASKTNKSSFNKSDKNSNATQLIVELEQDLMNLQNRHQKVAYKLKASREYDIPIDTGAVESELQNLLEKMEIKSQHIQMARTINYQVNHANNPQKELHATSKYQPSNSISTRTSTASCNNHRNEQISSPLDLVHNKAALPTSNLTALRTMRNLQTTLRAEDLCWD